MKKTSAFAVAAALMFSTAAFAQQSAADPSAPNMKTTADGVTPTPDSTTPSTKSNSSMHKKHAKKKHHKSSSAGSNSSSDASTGQAPNMQTTPDGVTRTPDATVPPTR
jgi:hypothetical protein